MRNIKFYTIVFIWLCAGTVAAQPYNDWIGNNPHLKLSIAETGIYRVTAAELSSFDPLFVIIPDRLQLFHRGEQVAINVVKNASNLSYFEFYAEAIDGKSDTPLYPDPADQSHTYYNLFSDTTAYFLTYDISSFGLRTTHINQNPGMGATPISYFYDEKILVLHDEHYAGITFGVDNQQLNAYYNESEGWTGPFTKLGETYSTTIPGLNNLYTLADPPQLTTQITGRNNNAHNILLRAGGRLIETINFSGRATTTHTEDILWSDISGGSLSVSINPTGVGGLPDVVSMNYAKLRYPRGFNVSGDNAMSMELPVAASGNQSYVRLDNAGASSRWYDITNPIRPIEIRYNASGGNIGLLIENTDQVRTLYWNRSPKSVPVITQVDFELIPSAQVSNYDYIILTEKSFHEPYMGQDQIEAYKNYRQSVAGGGYRVLTIDIAEVFDQFNYGEISPLAIRNLCQHMYNDGQPKHLFIVGKASDVWRDYYRLASKEDITHFVPTFGHPGSDVLFSATIDGSAQYEVFPTGRINARTPEDVHNYLQKVIQKESQPHSSLRQKHLVQLSGGRSENEIRLFRAYAEDFAFRAEQNYLGGASTILSKNNYAAIEFINIADEINDGAMFVTFFGHSASSSTDIEIGKASDPAHGYNNKYFPIFLLNGCKSGDFFSEDESFGVDWILTPNRGATGFLAMSDLGLSSNLKLHSDIFYNTAFNDVNFINKTVGEIKKETSKRYLQKHGTSDKRLAQAQTQNLQGDPAVKIFAPDKPDYHINKDLISYGTFDGEPIRADVDSFYLDIDIKNYGIGVDNETIDIQVVHTSPTGVSTTYGPIPISPILYQDTVRLTLKNFSTPLAGQNTFTVTIDPINEIGELNENNNTGTIELFLYQGSTINLLPYSNALVTERLIDFYFQIPNVYGTTRDFDFELDTIANFSSGYRHTTTIGTDVVGKVSFDLESRGSLPPRQVFYWRTRLSEPNDKEDRDWVTSSFVYAPAQSEGWNQHRAKQFRSNELIGLEVSNNGIWSFQDDITREIDVKTYGALASIKETHTKIDGADFNLNRCPDNTFNALAIDAETFFSYNPQSGVHNRICGRSPATIVYALNGQVDLATGLADYIDKLKEGDYVILFSISHVDYSSWSPSTHTALEQVGVSSNLLIDKAQRPVIILGRKGATPGTAMAVIGADNTRTISLIDQITAAFTSGSVTSQLIGPAQRWSQAQINISDQANDNWTLQVIGSDDEAKETTLTSTNTVGLIDLSTYSTTDYPYLRLKLQLQDETDITPPQLHNWQVNYTPVPEGVLIKHDQSDLENTNYIQAGEKLESHFTYWNISNKDFPNNLNVRYDLQRRKDGKILKDSISLEAISAGDSANFTIDTQSFDFIGTSDLLMSVVDNREQYAVNSQARFAKYLDIEADETNPSLEVLFDGINIMDGDIVSPQPVISIRSKDHNSFIQKEDTIGMHVYLKHPCDDCQYDRVAFSSPQIVWKPATDSSPFEIEYRPEKLEDGVFNLKVEAVDGSGNSSGIRPYEVAFEVINASTITNFYPYPNPFSSSTRFVFTLTGSQIPEDIKIQILTVTGRVVREIFMDELGYIHIGHNKTEFAWDGRDNYGDQLANGVYLYRVLIKEPGENFKHRDTNGDRGFKNGFGKMYLLR